MQKLVYKNQLFSKNPTYLLCKEFFEERRILILYLMIKQQVKHLSKEDYHVLRDLSHTAKNLVNEAIYSIRQHYFKTGEYLSYNKNDKLMKTSPNYRKLNSNMAQQILKEVDGAFQSFFGLIRNKEKCNLPHYLPKDGFTTLIIGFVRIDGNRLLLPYSRSYKKKHKPVIFTLPPVLADKKIKEIRILPKNNARFFEIQYVYETDCIKGNLNKQHALALDPGVDNLLTAATSEGKSFIIDGRKLKSINQWYNKQNARLQSIKDKQHFKGKLTHLQGKLLRKRNNRVNDYMSKSARYIIDYCIANNIGTLVIGYNTSFQEKSHLGGINNQNFVNIPFGTLKKKLVYLCALNDIRCIIQEESYTSRASFFEQDELPVYSAESKEEYTFSGKRIHRGMYRRKNGQMIHADVNGALNILRKSNVVSLDTLYARGDVATPLRIRIT